MAEPSREAVQPILQPSVEDIRLSQSLTLEGLGSSLHSHGSNSGKSKGNSNAVAQPPGDEDLPSPGLRRRSFSQRTIRDMTIHGIRHSFLTLTSTALGGGLLAVAFVMAQVGVGLGILMLMIGAMLAYLSTVVLMQISIEIGECSFAGLFSYCAGPRAGPILDTMLFLYGNGCCVNFFCFLGDFIPDLVRLLAPLAPGWCSSRWLAITSAAVLIVPMALQRELAALRFMTPVSIISLVYAAAVIAARCVHYYSEHTRAADHAEYGELKVIDFNINLFNAFSICVFAFNCHINVIPVAGRLVRPTRQRIQKVALWVNILQVAFYILIGLTGYLTFLAKTPGDILKGFKVDDPFIAVARFLLSFAMIVAIVMNVIPTVRCGLQARDYFFPDNPFLLPSPSNSPRTTPRDSPVLPSRQALPLAGEASGNSPASPRSDSGQLLGTEPALPRIFLTLLSLVIEVLIAIVVPNVAIVISLLGATVATAMMMVIPAWAIGKVLPYSIWHRCQQAMLLFFACVSFASVPINILQTAHVIPS